MRWVLALSIFFNVVLAAIAAYLAVYDPTVATVTTPLGRQRTVLAGVVNREMATLHGEEVLSDLVGRLLIDLAAEESHIELDRTELEARWQLWLTEPGVQARIDAGETTAQKLRDQLVTLVLLDQLSWNDLNLSEQEEQMKKYFEAHSREFEQLHLRHILVESQKDAEEVMSRLAAGVDFSELARRFSLDPLTRDQGGDLGWKKRADLTEDLRSFIFLIPVGAASNPLGSASGWHIFLVEERKDTYIQCRDDVRRELTQQRRPETLSALRERFKVDRFTQEELLKKLERPGFFQDPQPPVYNLDSEIVETPQVVETPQAAPTP